jgi:hypothetical protein
MSARHRLDIKTFIFLKLLGRMLQYAETVISHSAIAPNLCKMKMAPLPMTDSLIGRYKKCCHPEPVEGRIVGLNT